MGKFDQYVFNAQPDYDEAALREAFSHAIPLKTLVIYCYDPRAAEIPHAVAKMRGDEVYPGEVIRDKDGNGVASTATLFPIIVAGGRAIDALRSITVGQHLFRGIKNIYVVHHSYCGGTSYTSAGIKAAYKREQHVDISKLYEEDSVCISDFEESLTHDVVMIRSHLGTPAIAAIYGYLYEINKAELIEVAKDIPGKGFSKS